MTLTVDDLAQLLDPPRVDVNLLEFHRRIESQYDEWIERQLRRCGVLDELMEEASDG